MESLSSVGTIVSIAQDVVGAVATASRNRKRCRKLAKRVQGISGLLRELDAVAALGTATTDAATRSLLRRLEEALRHALELVRACRESRCPCSLLAGRRMAGRFDDVDGEIDGCLLDLGIANRILLQKLVLREHGAAVGTETVTVRIGMPCDDTADHIKRCIHTLQGVTNVSPAASTNGDQFSVTVRSGADGAVDIPSLLDQVKLKLNRNVELVTPAGTKKHIGEEEEQAKKGRNISATVRDKQRPRNLYDGGDEIKREKMINQHAPAPHAYIMPFPVPLVPVGNAANMYQAPPPYGFSPYPQGSPAGHPVHVQQQSYAHRAYSNSNETHEGAGDDKRVVKGVGDVDEMKGKVADGNGYQKTSPAHTVYGERKHRDKMAETGYANAAAIGVPVEPPRYGYGYWPHGHNRGTSGHHHGNGSSPSDATPAYLPQYHSNPSMFSDEDPNACSIM
ncbi:hypothetical protein ACP4OV_016246 [Aristida adscensionis]